MIRLTHRRCRHEVEGLADTALRQTERAEDLAVKVEHRDDDLRAAEHRLDEITAACEDAVIPEILRTRLLDADDRQFVLDEHSAALARIDALTDQQERTLRAAHEAGMFARVYALMAGAGPAGVPDDLAELLSQITTIHWTDSPWACVCGSYDVILVWHPSARHRARLACECGRIWTTPGAVDRGEAVLADHTRFPERLSQAARSFAVRSAHELAAIDQALPTATEVRRAAQARAVPA